MRKRQSSSVRRRTAVLAFAAALSALLLAPQVSSAGLLNNVLNGVNNLLGGGGGGGGGAAAPAGNTPSGPGGYQPPLHGSNPHGQGTVGVVDVAPNSVRPLPADSSQNGEDIVVGRARGEDTDGQGNYHGEITIASVLGIGLLTVETNEGQSAAGPLDAVQTGVLDMICAGSGVCLSVLTADSNTTDTGSTNHFQLLGANLADAIVVGLGDSNGNISHDPQTGCQTSHGDSTVAAANVVGLTANAAQSQSNAEACPNQAPTQSNSSSVINLAGTGIPIPATGCDNGGFDTGTPDTVFSLPPVLGIVALATVCNADDSNGVGESVVQAPLPYGVREALSVFVVVFGDAALLKATTAASESAAVAQEPAPPPPPPPSDAPDGPGGPAGPAGPAAGPAQPGDGALPFTGAQVALLGLIGAAMLGTGLLVRGVSARRRHF